MKSLLRSVPVVVVSVTAIGYAFLPAPANNLPRALVVSPYGDDGATTSATVAAMTARGWTVQAVRSSGLAAEPTPLTQNWDVVWMLPGFDTSTQWRINDGTLEGFASDGGTVVVLGVGDGESMGLDAIPGGGEVMPEAAAGSTTVVAPAHALIAASAVGGHDLTSAELDPSGTGGVDCLDPGLNCECLATNAGGHVLVTYDLGAGHVVASALDLQHAHCTDNLLLYVESIVAGQ